MEPQGLRLTIRAEKMQINAQVRAPNRLISAGQPPPSVAVNVYRQVAPAGRGSPLPRSYHPHGTAVPLTMTARQHHLIVLHLKFNLSNQGNETWK